jgi:hypothetical protein
MNRIMEGMADMDSSNLTKTVVGKMSDKKK